MSCRLIPTNRVLVLSRFFCLNLSKLLHSIVRADRWYRIHLVAISRSRICIIITLPDLDPLRPTALPYLYPSRPTILPHLYSFRTRILNRNLLDFIRILVSPNIGLFCLSSIFIFFLDRLNIRSISRIAITPNIRLVLSLVVLCRRILIVNRSN